MNHIKFYSDGLAMIEYAPAENDNIINHGAFHLIRNKLKNMQMKINWFISATIFMLIIGANPTLVAQDSQKIKGKIVDAQTGSAIELATILSKSAGKGTISNSDGLFEYNSNMSLPSDSLVISCIGYEPLTIRISAFLNSYDTIFKLTPVVYTLNTVLIEPMPKAEAIIEKAKANLDINYCQKPFLADCYFNEFIKEDGKYVRAMELAIEQYNKGSFPNPMITIPMQQIKIIEKRKSANNTQLKDSPINRCFSLNYLLTTSNLRNYLSGTNRIYTLDSITKIRNQPVYVISGRNENEKITYYITVVDYKILTLEFLWSSVLPKYKIGDYFFTISQTAGTLVFREVNNTLYPFYTSNVLQISYFENKSDTKAWHEQEISSELLYSNIITENVKEIDKNERVPILTYPNIYNLDIPYNEEYWRRNSSILESTDKMQIFNSIMEQNN